MNSIPSQRWIALALLAAVILLLSFIVFVPFVSQIMDLNEQEDDLLFRLNRVQKIIARKDVVSAESTRIKSQYQSQNYFSNHNTAALASADLQKFVRSAISQAGGQLTSSQVLPNKSQDGFRQVTIKVNLILTDEALRRVLHEIESSLPMMIVNQINIRPVRGKHNRKTKKMEPTGKLTVGFQVTRFMRAQDL